MRIVTALRLREFARRYPAAAVSLQRWTSIVRASAWSSLDDLRLTFPSADEVRLVSGSVVTVFNISGNRFRLIVAIHYNRGVVFIRDFLTHAEYSKDRWKWRH